MIVWIGYVHQSETLHGTFLASAGRRPLTAKIFNFCYDDLLLSSWLFGRWLSRTWPNSEHFSFDIGNIHHFRGDGTFEWTMKLIGWNSRPAFFVHYHLDFSSGTGLWRMSLYLAHQLQCPKPWHLPWIHQSHQSVSFCADSSPVVRPVVLVIGRSSLCSLQNIELHSTHLTYIPCLHDWHEWPHS